MTTFKHIQKLFTFSQKKWMQAVVILGIVSQNSHIFNIEAAFYY